MKLCPALTVAILALGTSVAAQEIRSGSTADLLSEANRLFATPNQVTVTAVALTASGVTGQCAPGTPPEEIQFGVARGYLGANGFVLSNAWVENQDQEVPALAMQSEQQYFCAEQDGLIGGLPSAGDCNGTDTVLSGLLNNALGQPVATEDAAVFRIDFDVAANTLLDLSYSLATFESPTDLVFYDAFGITLDGQLVAGGRTNGSAPAGTDPWNLSPSSTSPHEFNELGGSTFYVVPAHSTGLRTMSLALAAGSHVLEFHVADSGDTVIEPSCNASSDNSVDTSLFVGLHTYQTGHPGSVTPSLKIGRTGHPALNGGPFGPDLQVTLEGAPPAAILILLQAPQAGVAATIPLFAPHELLIGLFPFQLITTQNSSGTGLDVFPPTGVQISTAVAGRSFFFQWWSLTGAGFENTRGMALHF